MPVSAHHPSRPGVHPDVWLADALADAPTRVLATGDALLDAQLPGGGWPLGALNEILQPDGVHSEWRLLLPALACSGTGTVVLRSESTRLNSSHSDRSRMPSSA